MFRLNRNWKKFDTALRTELKKLQATEEETEAILQAAWETATEVEDVTKYAREKLELIHSV